MTDTTEVRVTSASGASKGSKLARFDLIPANPLRELAEHYGKGAEKYPQVNGLDNWRNGYDFSLTIAALQRHLNSYLSGEDYDEETGSKHIIAVAWHAFTIAEFMNHPDLVERFDNRQDTPTATERRLAAAAVLESAVAALAGAVLPAAPPAPAAPAAPPAPAAPAASPAAASVISEVPGYHPQPAFAPGLTPRGTEQYRSDPLARLQAEEDAARVPTFAPGQGF